MKFLIAGFGSIGRRHMQNLLALGERDIVFYRTHRSTLPEKELEGFAVETDLNSALKHQPDGVIIANPSAKHLDVAIPAAEAGCHILMEKPVSDSMDRLDDLDAALKKNGSRMLVGFQYRFHPGLRQVKRLLNEGAIGRPLSFRAQWSEYLPGWHPWEDYRQSYSARRDLGGGVVLTLCHPLDYVRWLLGEVKSITAFTGKISDLEMDVEDCAEIGLGLENGAHGSVHLDYFQRPAVHRLEISGTEGSLRWDNADGAVQVYRVGANAWENFPAPDGFERNTMFLEETRHFIEVIKGHENPLCTLQDGVRALQMTMAIYKASEEQRVVEF
jgi:predicted dehydrogenase